MNPEPEGPPPAIDIDTMLADATPEQLRGWAACWLTWWQPAAVDYRAEERERWYARRIRAVSTDLAAATAWSEQAPIGHAELARRRYPWLHDPDWQPPHPYPGGPVPWNTDEHRGGPVHWLTGEAA